MKNKVITLAEAIDKITDGASIMISGFLGNGTPHSIIDGILAKGVKDLTIISNDTGIPGVGISKLIAAKVVKRAMVSHIGTNPETGKQMIAGTLDVELVPQGTLAERIRAAGAGLGGVLTPTGVGTEVAKGKQTLTLNGREYLLELPLKADFAILGATIADTFGNAFFNGSTKNFNPLMATAADTVIVEAAKIVEPGELDPNIIMAHGIFVDYIVRSNSND
jgi:acetate CoA/acetoacetate CoA-transferase alpha subunit